MIRVIRNELIKGNKTDKENDMTRLGHLLDKSGMERKR